ncbi:MAG TPA: bifunctional demethylmenaquinone methyltransferase/2-methoxy-6-polyprenyl-1,4-benzoquinol methylase UbiE [Bryobacteraceae bacterium]|nr:bifunctional demethylmenaquinone methyltransferase/2-methoxy-6-polyprenyl-1,4-benzoquinol methylase UbiE [Bryobacteraceae bacterium]
MGTTPPGTHGERDAAAWVREMFDRIAPRYDLLNHLLSFNVDRLWRRRTVARVGPVLERAEARVVDLCCGTGDLMRALAGNARARIFGSDFSHPMLVRARHKAAAASVFESDVLRLPLRDASVDLVTVAFGFRNLANYEAGLREFRRVLRRGGLAAILEFSTPPNPLFARLYGWYANRVLPRIGGAISGAPHAYRYLPQSVRSFPAPEELERMMRRAGFARVRWERMTFGIVALHLGTV